VDLSAPNPSVWSYLRGFVEQYDSAILSMPDYAQELGIEQRFITPAVNPFSPKNREMSDDEIDDCLEHYRVPSDRPLVVQVSRFDRWKDPLGVIEAFRKATEQVDATLVLVGNNAVDDPGCGVILETIQSSLDERVIVLTVDDPNLVNALQRPAAVVLQKSIREGFGLTVTEAMWKGAAVVGSNVGGIRRQIRDGQNGFLVGSIDQAAERIVQILKNSRLRQQFGARARETVRDNFLMSRLVEDWIDVLSVFERRLAQ
jgi:trehalose synthase